MLKFSLSGPYNKYNDSCDALKQIDRDVYLLKAETTFQTIDGRTVTAGTHGGYVESGANLSHDGGCWIFPGSVVIGDSVISGNTIIEDECCISNSKIDGNCFVYFSAILDSEITGEFKSSSGVETDAPNLITNSHISGNTVLLDGATVKNTIIYPDTFTFATACEINQCELTGINTILNHNAFRVALVNIHLNQREIWTLSYDIFDGQQQLIKQLMRKHGFDSGYIMELPVVTDFYARYQDEQKKCADKLGKENGDSIEELFGLKPVSND